MRRRRAEKRQVLPDPKFKNELLSKFVNIVMISGKKSIAEHTVYRALDIAKGKLKAESEVEILTKAVHNARPLLQLKSRRVGGATYQIPVEIKEDKGMGIAMRWIRDTARERKGKAMHSKLADELAEAFNGQGSAVKKRDEVHRMAEANRAFSHYRW